VRSLPPVQKTRPINPNVQIQKMCRLFFCRGHPAVCQPFPAPSAGGLERSPAGSPPRLPRNTQLPDCWTWLPGHLVAVPNPAFRLPQRRQPCPCAAVVNRDSEEALRPVAGSEPQLGRGAAVCVSSQEAPSCRKVLFAPLCSPQKLVIKAGFKASQAALPAAVASRGRTELSGHRQQRLRQPETSGSFPAGGPPLKGTASICSSAIPGAVSGAQVCLRQPSRSRRVEPAVCSLLGSC